MFRAQEICKHLFYKHLDRPNHGGRVTVTLDEVRPYIPPLIISSRHLSSIHHLSLIPYPHYSSTLLQSPAPHRCHSDLGSPLVLGTSVFWVPPYPNP